MAPMAGDGAEVPRRAGGGRLHLIRGIVERDTEIVPSCPPVNSF